MVIERISRVRYESTTYELQPEETVLDGFIRGGANVRFSCRRGTCHVCMLQVSAGDPGVGSQRGLEPSQREAGLFLPCQARPCGDLEVVAIDPSVLVVETYVQERECLSASVVCLRLEPVSTVTWRPGQFITLEHPSGALRSYSVASSFEQDYYLELHIRRVPGGLVSTWLCDEVEVGDVLRMRGPSGDCSYDPTDAERDLVLIAGGTGMAPLIGVARDALRLGHRGRISLFHGSTSADGLYLHEQLRALADAHGPDRVRYAAWLDGEGPCPEGVERGQVVDAAFAEALPEPRNTILYLAGPPAMVYAARHRAMLAGFDRANIHADPFEDSRPYMPDDKAKIEAIEADPELWRALDEGPGLTTILTDFYGRVYEDPLLSPFFRDTTKQRAIEKQYEFLSELFTGHRHFLGARPFNAHHWMVISDELFDFREALLDDCMRRHGLAEDLIRRWSATHELFRREIVKTHRRGMILDGVERVEEGYREEVLDFDSICDGCSAEIPARTPARHHLPSGKLYCAGCEGESMAAG